MKMHYTNTVRVRKPYGCLAFIFDCIMTCITGGLWLIWVFCREMRKRSW